MSQALIVEDEPSIVQIVSEILGDDLGVRPTETASGEAALRMLQCCTFDLIVLDLGLPGEITGWHLLKMLRTPGSKHFETPIIVISGHTEADGEARACGASDFLSKPFSITQLIECVQRLLQL